MDKHAVLSEIFYIIANYEKGRVKPSGLWSPWYVASLRKSLCILNELISLMKSKENISANKILPILDFIKTNTGRIFPVSPIGVYSICDHGSKICLRNTSRCIECDSIFDLMTQIVSKCISLLDNRGQGYKTQVIYLLQALHNLPKVFLNPDQNTLFGIGIKPISVEDAMKYSLFYIEKANIDIVVICE